VTQEQRQFAINILRRNTWKWYSFAVAKMRARVERGKYRCAICSELFGPKLIELDHRVTVVPLNGWDSLDGFVQRLLCTPEDLQVLCKPCHKDKTLDENRQRRRIVDERS
jgi:5-methylcytosine-specific restriction endonuclease McrA